jgi:hypothetical protein
MSTSKTDRTPDVAQTKTLYDEALKSEGTASFKPLVLSIALISVTLWLGSLPYWLQKPFTPLERTDMRQSEGIEAILRPVTRLYAQLGKPVVLSLYRPNCLCNWVSMRHETQIESFAAEKGVPFQRLDASNINIPSTPALLILDGTGNILYFGAYGFGAFCSQNLTPYAQKQLTLMLRGDQTEPFYNLLGNGCYCRQEPITPGIQRLDETPFPDRKTISMEEVSR